MMKSFRLDFNNWVCRCLFMLGALLVVIPAAECAWEWHSGIALDYWKVEWTRKSFTADGNGLFGPRARVNYGPMSMEALYLTGDFDVHELDMTAERKDSKISFQYRLHPNFYAMVGYEHFNYNMKKTGYEQTETVKGIALGLGGLYSFYPNFYGFVAASLRPASDMDQEAVIRNNTVKKYSYTTKAEGFDLESGIGYTIPAIRLGIILGYRQNTLDPRDKDDFSKNTFSGFITRVVWNIL